MKILVILAVFAIFAVGSQAANAQSENSQPDTKTDSELQKPDVEAPQVSPEESFALDAVKPNREPSKEAAASLAMIAAALKKIDENIEREGSGWQFKMGDRFVLIVTDPLAERMRIITPIAPVDALTQDVLLRIMQANFDSALDARYAVGQNLLWGTFVHSLNGLSEDEFLSGLLQTINVAQTFGSSFSSGAIVFGGGDSQGIVEGQLEELIKKREDAGKI